MQEITEVSKIQNQQSDTSSKGSSLSEDSGKAESKNSDDIQATRFHSSRTFLYGKLSIFRVNMEYERLFKEAKETHRLFDQSTQLDKFISDLDHSSSRVICVSGSCSLGESLFVRSLLVASDILSF